MSQLDDGRFDTPEGAAEPAPLMPGESYVMSFAAAPEVPGVTGETRLMFASMFVPSNDLFFAPLDGGIRLYDDDGEPITGDVTDQIAIWDAGTEADEPLNGDAVLSPNQKPHQALAAMDVGPEDPDDTVRLAEETYPVSLPAIDTLVEATLMYEEIGGIGRFELVLTNISEGAFGTEGPFGGAVPMSPGVYSVIVEEPDTPGVFFTPGTADYDEGLADIAEDGVPTRLGETIAPRTGVTFVASPGIWVVHTESVQLFDVLRPLPEIGLEALAEDGDPTPAIIALLDTPGVYGVGQLGTDPIAPGESHEVFVEGEPNLGFQLSLATMAVPSNDVLFATASPIGLYDEVDFPIDDQDASESVQTWDAGTEVDQLPGLGLDQVHLQDGLDIGAEQAEVVSPAGDAYPDGSAVLTLEITALD